MKLPLKNLLTATLISPAFLFSVLSSAAPYQRSATGVYFSDNQQINVTLSNTNPNKIIIEGELITKLDGMEGAYQESQTNDGALILNPTSGQNFTVFLQTDNGLSVSLNITPQAGAGKTLRLIPDAPPNIKNDAAKSWEEDQPYVDTLENIAREFINGSAPDSFVEYPVSRAEPYQPALAIQLTPERQAIGSHLRVVRYRMRNPGSITLALQEKQFFRPGIRAVTLSTRQLYPGGEGYAWVIFSFSGGDEK